jgi:hypothetical protein
VKITRARFKRAQKDREAPQNGRKKDAAVKLAPEDETLVSESSVYRMATTTNKVSMERGTQCGSS